MFTIAIRNRNGTPVEGEVSAANIDDAITVARQMGHDVDEEASRKLAALQLDTSGKAAATVGFLLAFPAVLFPYVGVAAIVLSTLAIEFSKGRRGLPALTASVCLTAIGLLLQYLNVMLVNA